MIDNPQLDTVGGIGRHPARMRGGTCVACDRPIPAGADYILIFYGSRTSPKVFAAAHDYPLLDTSWERNAKGWPINPCQRKLERVYHCLLDDANILRYLATDKGLGLWHRGLELDSGDLAVANGGGEVLLASGRWARANFTPGTEHPPLHLESQSGTRPGPNSAPPIPAPALFRPGGASGRASSRDEPGRWFGHLVASADSGDPRWFIHEDPISTGEALEVFLPGTGWSMGRLETTNGGSQANVHVALATPNGGPVDLVLPATGLDVRPHVVGFGRGGFFS